jgi:DNA-binding transcriptional regulator YiaG
MKTSYLCSKINGGDCRNRIVVSTLYTCIDGHSPCDYDYFESGSVVEPILWAKIRFDQDSLTRNDLETIAREGMTSKIIKYLARSNSNLAHLFLAKTQGDRSKVLLYVAKADMEEASSFIASRSNLATQIYENLVASKHLAARVALAANNSISTEVMCQLANDQAIEVRQALAANNSISTEAIFILSKESQVSVIANLVSNSSISLASRIAISKKVDLTEIASKATDPILLEKIATTSTLTPALLEALSTNENLTSDTFAVVLSASDSKVAKKLANNKSFPTSLSSLLLDKVELDEIEETIELLVESRSVYDYDQLLEAISSRKIRNEEICRKIISLASATANVEKVINIPSMPFEKEKYNYLYEVLEMFKACNPNKVILKKTIEAIEFVMA